jgi:lipopolysaccharide/colanic/teichoic acid biosynthesis glycosyltransferase
MLIKRVGAKPHKPYYQFFKRILDVLICAVTLPLVLPVGLLIMAAIRRDSEGPVFFVQERVGKGGRLFKLYKFRTMYHNIDRAAHQKFMETYVKGQLNAGGEQKLFKPFPDKDVTRVGRFLRKSSLDELPQLINVLKGEMSLIGPRPNVPSEVKAYLSWHKERFEVLPGITGLAQVQGRSSIVFDRIVEYDIEYIKKQSLLLDLKILWWTFTTILIGKNAG